jgi:hypothetical protein
MRHLPGKAVVVLASGYILFFFSERVFWSFWRPNDDPREFLVTWLVYCLLGWVVLLLVRGCRIASWMPLFLAGAVYGWLGEGVVVDTMYGDKGNPFPLSLSFTGLSWHALISVGVGWYAIGKAMTLEKPARTFILALAVGVGWGLWAVWWPRELKGTVDTTVWAFASHAFPCTALLMLAWSALGLARPEWFQGGRVASVVLAVLAGLVFLAARVPARPMSALVLPPLLLVCWLALRRQSGRDPGPDVLDELLGRVRLRNVPALLVIPVAAVATYAPFRAMKLHAPTNVLLYVITMPLGFWIFFRSLWVVFRREVTGDGGEGRSGSGSTPASGKEGHGIA